MPETNVSCWKPTQLLVTLINMVHLLRALILPMLRTLLFLSITAWILSQWWEGTALGYLGGVRFGVILDRKCWHLLVARGGPPGTWQLEVDTIEPYEFELEYKPTGAMLVPGIYTVINPMILGVAFHHWLLVLALTVTYVFARRRFNVISEQAEYDD